MPDVLCAWCNTLIGQSAVEHSHGICRACSNQLRGLPDLSESELDDLPFGAIVLAQDGTVRSYNRAEGELASRNPSEVIGRNFFTDIAPCTSVQAFKGALLAFSQGEQASRTFGFTFRFPSGPVQVQIVFLHKGPDVAVAIRKRLSQDT